MRIAGLRSWQSYEERFNFGSKDYSYAASLKVANWLRENAHPEDRLVVWGSEPIVNYLSGMRSTTRFGFNHPLTSGPPAVRDRYRDELITSLRHTPPAFFLVVDRDRSNLRARTSKQFLEEWPVLTRWLAEDYRLVHTIEDFQIYGRRAIED